MWSEPFDLPFSGTEYRFNLECVADFQLGSRSCCRWKIIQHIEDILENAKTTDSGVVVAGDLEDEDRPSTRVIRAKIAAERGEVRDRDAEKHMAWLDKDVIPLLLRLHEGTKYGIMGGVAGHHWTQLTEYEEADGSKVPAMNSVQYIFRELQRKTGKPCKYLGEMVSFLDFRFKHKSGQTLRQVGLLQHGEGGGQTKGSTVNKLERAAQGFDADFYIRGHDCQLVGTKTDQLYAKASRGGDNNAIASRTKAMLNLGSATMGYEMRRDSSSYIESAMMRPATMGWGTIKFKIRKSLAAEDPNQNWRADMKLEF
jgi:hypothetical protein